MLKEMVNSVCHIVCGIIYGGTDAFLSLEVGRGGYENTLVLAT